MPLFVKVIKKPIMHHLEVATGASNLSRANTNTATVNWNNASTGNLIVYETNSFGCVDSFALCIEQVDLPIANS